MKSSSINQSQTKNYVWNKLKNGQTKVDIAYYREPLKLSIKKSMEKMSLGKMHVYTATNLKDVNEKSS